MTHLKVIIRVRPLSAREKDNGCIPIVEVQNNNNVAITNIKVVGANAGDSRQRVRRFTFDGCFSEDATQNDIFTKVEAEVSRSMKRRFHSCVFAYGQSSTGKTHTMMGFPHDPGLTPRLSQKIYGYLRETSVGNELENMKTTISYLEIYNEKVRDLLHSDEKTGNNSKTLRIREHPKKGPYVQDLTEQEVHTQEELLDLIQCGNENRRVASTFRNSHSSRSHSVVTITCDGVRLYLVDLAGSEKAVSKACATSRFREGANINKSLVALGSVISALAEKPPRLKTNRKRFVPYRDSVLTWLLKDTLGGNSNTVMIATVSPSSGCYSETVNTFRFGQRAQLLESCPVVNEDPKEKIILELRLEIAKLRELLRESKVEFSSHMLEEKIDPDKFDDGVSVVKNISDSVLFEGSPSTNSNFENNEEFELELSGKNKKIRGPEFSTLRIGTDKLISVMNVETSVSYEKKQIPKIRRNSSVDPVRAMSRTSSFGSHESLPSVSKKKVLEPNMKSSKTLSSSDRMIRRRSVDKSLRNLIQSRSIPEVSKKTLEKSVGTEASKNPSKLKADPTKKLAPKQKSNIVANVTRRLYLKSKNKDSETDMEGFEDVKDETPKELTICSNARLRLKELTQKALRAHRFKQVETQTDTKVLRVKEISTDVQDLRLRIVEVRDVDTMTTVDTKDAMVGCSMLDISEMTDRSNLMKITKTVGVQCSDVPSPLVQNMEYPPKIEYSPPKLSFSKFLQNKSPPFQASIECLNPNISNSIQTGSVNINVTHHYISERRTESLSDDSLDDQNVCNMLFPTPDLISNHNSLDPNIHAMQNEQPDSSISRLKIRYAQDNVDNVHYEDLEFSNNTKLKMKSARACTIMKMQETIAAVKIPICAFLPERNFCDNFFTCDYLPTPQLELARAVIIHVEDSVSNDILRICQPTILKSCFRNSFNPVVINNDSINSMSDYSLLKDVSDSLEYHRANDTKHVHFSQPSTRNEKKVFEAMSSFLEAATELMTNISKANENFVETRDFDLHMTLDDVNDLKNIFQSEKNMNKTEYFSGLQMKSQNDFVSCCDSSSQTSTLEKATHFTQYEVSDVPSNKFDSILEDACDKFNNKLNAISNGRTTSIKLESAEDSLFSPQLSHESSFSGISEVDEDLSLESDALSCSGYGSLSRRHFKKRLPSCRPSAFLRQLSHMRKYVMDSSRRDTLDDEGANGNK